MDQSSEEIYDDFDVQCENKRTFNEPKESGDRKVVQPNTFTRHKASAVQIPPIRQVTQASNPVTDDSRARKSLFEEIKKEHPVALRLDEFKNIAHKAGSVSNYSFSEDFHSDSEIDERMGNERSVQLPSEQERMKYVSSPNHGNSNQRPKKVFKQELCKKASNRMMEQPMVKYEKAAPLNLLNTEPGEEIKCKSSFVAVPIECPQQPTTTDVQNIAGRPSLKQGSQVSQKLKDRSSVFPQKQHQQQSSLVTSTALPSNTILVKVPSDGRTYFTLKELQEEKKELHEALRLQNENLTKMVEEQGYKNVLNRLKENKNDFKSRPVEVKSNTYQREIANNDKIISTLKAEKLHVEQTISKINSPSYLANIAAESAEQQRLIKVLKTEIHNQTLENKRTGQRLIDFKGEDKGSVEIGKLLKEVEAYSRKNAETRAQIQKLQSAKTELMQKKERQLEDDMQRQKEDQDERKDPELMREFAKAVESKEKWRKHIELLERNVQQKSEQVEREIQTLEAKNEALQQRINDCEFIISSQEKFVQEAIQGKMGQGELLAQEEKIVQLINEFEATYKVGKPTNFRGQPQKVNNAVGSGKGTELSLPPNNRSKAVVDEDRANVSLSRILANDQKRASKEPKKTTENPVGATFNYKAKTGQKNGTKDGHSRENQSVTSVKKSDFGSSKNIAKLQNVKKKFGEKEDSQSPSKQTKLTENTKAAKFDIKKAQDQGNRQNVVGQSKVQGEEVQAVDTLTKKDHQLASQPTDDELMPAKFQARPTAPAAPTIVTQTANPTATHPMHRTNNFEDDFDSDIDNLPTKPSKPADFTDDDFLFSAKPANFPNKQPASKPIVGNDDFDFLDDVV